MEANKTIIRISPHKSTIVLDKNYIKLTPEEEAILKRNKIERAEAQVSKILGDSKFVTFAKNMSINTGNKGKLKVNTDALIVRFFDYDHAKLKDLNALKEIFYEEGDQAMEDALYKTKQGSKTEIIKALINQRRQELVEALTQAEQKDALIKQMQENVEVINANVDREDEGEVVKEDIEPLINDLSVAVKDKEFLADIDAIAKSPMGSKVKISAMKKECSDARKEVEKMKELGIVMDVDQEQEQDQDEVDRSNKEKEADPPNIKDEELDKIVKKFSNKAISQKFKEVKKEQVDYKKAQLNQFLMNREKILQEIVNSLPGMQIGSVKDKSVSTLIEKHVKDNKPILDKEVFEYLKNNMNDLDDFVKPINAAITFELDAAKAKPKQLTKDIFGYTALLNACIVLCHKVNSVMKVVNGLYRYIINEQKYSDYTSNLGITGMRLNKQVQSKRTMLSKYAELKNYVSEEEWQKLTAYQKWDKRWVFNDYNQNPNRSVFSRFTQEDKKNFYIKYIDFRIKRMNAFHEKKEAGEGRYEIAKFLNNFFYYADRDRKGFKVQKDMKAWLEAKNSFKQEVIQTYERLEADLDEELKNLSKESAVIGKVFCKNKVVKCFGHAYFEYVSAENNIIRKRNYRTYKQIGFKRDRVLNNFPKDNKNGDKKGKNGNKAGKKGGYYKKGKKKKEVRDAKADGDKQQNQNANNNNLANKQNNNQNFAQ